MGVFHVALAQVEVFDLEASILEALKTCRRQLDGRVPGAALLWADMDLDHRRILESIHAEWPDLPLIGGTSGGEFSSHLGYTEDSFTLVLLASETVRFVSGSLRPGEDLEVQCLGARAQVEVTGAGEPGLGILLADGLSDGAEDALQALQSCFGEALPWTGGFCADRWTFDGVRQFHGLEVLQGAAVYLLLCGSFPFAIAEETGWKPIGRPGVVTRAEKNLVHEIDHAPAIQFYRELMGGMALPSVETPMAVHDPWDNYLFLRASLQWVDEGAGAVRYLASIPEGSRVRLTLVDRDSIIGAARKAADRALALFEGDGPSAALCFSCAARRVLLSSRAGEECRTLREVLGESIPLAGFYSYGELAPPEKGGRSVYRNESIVVLLLP